MNKISNLLIRKFQNSKFIRVIFKKVKILNELYYKVKAEIANKFLINNPPYNIQIHDQFIRTSWDPIRYGTLALALNTIRDERIIGGIAEVGVFRGESSKIIHILAPEKKLYLFDTFEGFPSSFLENGDIDNRFKDTRVEMVKRNIGDMTNVIIRKGVFPETAKGLEEENFSLVYLDLDLYISTLKALEFFYPKVPKGGFFYIHDYHNPTESKAGVFRAVNEFMKHKSEKIIEVPDVLGSVIFRKI